jgi:N-acetylmuramoyl-L-alanine amidase
MKGDRSLTGSLISRLTGNLTGSLISGLTGGLKSDLTGSLTAMGLGIATLGFCLPVQAQQSTFMQQEIAQGNFVAVAAPYGGGTAHQLMVIEQLRNSKACWAETRGPGPTQIEPLLANFDFTGICGRSLDSNGYSIRMAGEDLGMRYALRMIKTEDDMVLMGVPNRPEMPMLEIGRTQGLSSGFAKIQLNSGWRFTRRNYRGQSLGHVYLTHDSPLTTMVSQPVIPATSPTETTPPGQQPKEIIFSAPLPTTPLPTPLPPAR